MTPEEARKLLGGYATGTLTAEEQQALFAAALEDQGLFDELAREQALKDALDNPEVRAEVLAAATGTRKRSWLLWWPVPVGGAAVALAGLTVFLMVRHEAPRPKAEKTEIAARTTHAPEPAAFPEAAVSKSPAESEKKVFRAPAPQAEPRRRADSEQTLIEAAPPAQAAQAPAPSAGVTPAPITISPPEPPKKEKADVAAEATALVARDAYSGEPARAVAGPAMAKSSAMKAIVVPQLKYSWSGKTVTLEANGRFHLYLFRRDAGGEWAVYLEGVKLETGAPLQVTVKEGGEVKAMLTRVPVNDPLAVAATPNPAVLVVMLGTVPK